MSTADILQLLAVVGASIALAMWWLFCSRQSFAQPTVRNAAMITIRFCIVFVLTWGPALFSSGSGTPYTVLDLADCCAMDCAGVD